jgi:hypothetical protein
MQSVLHIFLQAKAQNFLHYYNTFSLVRAVIVVYSVDVVVQFLPTVHADQFFFICF